MVPTHRRGEDGGGDQRADLERERQPIAGERSIRGASRPSRCEGAPLQSASALAIKTSAATAAAIQPWRLHGSKPPGDVPAIQLAGISPSRGGSAMRSASAGSDTLSGAAVPTRSGRSPPSAPGCSTSATVMAAGTTTNAAVTATPTSSGRHQRRQANTSRSTAGHTLRAAATPITAAAARGRAGSSHSASAIASSRNGFTWPSTRFSCTVPPTIHTAATAASAAVPAAEHAQHQPERAEQRRLRSGKPDHPRGVDRE